MTFLWQQWRRMLRPPKENAWARWGRRLRERWCPGYLFVRPRRWE
jgi:hypothetical protein